MDISLSESSISTAPDRGNLWKIKNPERCKEIKRNWYHKNKAKIRESVKLRRKQNLESTRAKAREYYHKHREKRVQIARQKRKERPEVGREYSKRYRKKKGGDYLYQRASVKRQAFRAELNKIKLERGCVDCGYKAHAYALDFDHIRGTKKKSVSKCINMKSALEEIDKCEVRCSNCHRIKTLERRQFRGWLKRLEKKENVKG
jgi:hypothetical protein